MTAETLSLQSPVATTLSLGSVHAQPSPLTSAINCALTLATPRTPAVTLKSKLDLERT